MIDLNFERDYDGKYILVDFDGHGFTKEHLTTAGDAREGSSSSFWLKKGDKRYVVKSSLHNCYKLSQYGEMLFSEIAKKCNIPCANIDVAKMGELEFVVSEDVCQKDSERFAVDMFFGPRRFQEEELKNLTLDFSSVEGSDAFYSVDGIYDFAVRFAHKNGLEIEKELKNNLYKYAIIDFLCCQIDRHGENLMFEIVQENGIKKLRICPLFDNEMSFMFFYVQDKLREVELKYKEIPSGLTEAEYERRYIKEASEVSKNHYYPLLGPDFEVHTREIDIAGGIIGILKDIHLGEKMLLNFATSFAVEIENNKELKDFYDKLDVNIFECAKNIKKQTGFNIPEEYLYLAEEIYYSRKQMLDKELKDYEEMVMGE